MFAAAAPAPLTPANVGAVSLTGDTMTGALQVPAGLVSAPGLQVGDADTGLHQTAGVLSAAVDGVDILDLTSTAATINGLVNETKAGGGSCSFTMSGEGTTGLNANRYSANTSAPTFNFGKARGTIASPEVVLANDVSGQLSFRAHTGAAFVSTGLVQVKIVAATPSASDLESEMAFNTVQPATVTSTETMKVRYSTGLSLYSSVVIDQNHNHQLRVYTVATLPTATSGLIVQVSDLGGGAGMLVADGTGWLQGQGGQATVSSNADFTLTPLTSAPNQKHTGTLTAGRTITLSTTNARPGSWFRITRTGSGAFNLSVGGLKNLVQNTWALVAYDGSAWYLAQYGAL